MPKSPSNQTPDTPKAGAAGSKIAKSNITDEYGKFKELLAAKTPPAILLIISPDKIRRERMVTAFLNNYSAGAVNLSKFRAGDLSIPDLARLRDEGATLSLFSSNQFIVISDLQEITPALEKNLAEILKNSSASTVHVLVSEKLPLASPIYKACEKHGVVVKLEPLKGVDLKRWIAAECKRSGIINPGPEVIEGLKSIGEEIPDKISALVSQLALYIDGDSATAADLAKLFPESYDPNEFELVDALLTPGPARREVLLQQLCNRGKNPFMLLGMIARSVCNYCAISALLEQGKNPAVIQQTLGMTPWVFNKNIGGAKRWSRLQHIKHLKAVLRADSKLKNKSLGPESVFSELFQNFR